MRELPPMVLDFPALKKTIPESAAEEVTQGALRLGVDNRVRILDATFWCFWSVAFQVRDVVLFLQAL